MDSLVDSEKTGENQAPDNDSPLDPGISSEQSSCSHTPLGRPGCPIRVLNFAGGGFDTIMQLGVAHALLVIQGRAPDAIVGVSAGAIQAVAVAEVLQAGEDIDADQELDDTQKADNYQRRRAARVERFREMVNAAQKAPEELIDASLPDAYQIESHDPLQPLRTARFTKEERDAREHQLQVRSGLIALYNDLLGVHLPVGTITRIVRRWLGYRAADAIPDHPGLWPGRDKWAVKVLELFRIWLLIGATLPRLVTLMPLLLRPLFLGLSPRLFSCLMRTRVATAGSLIFRVPSLHFLGVSIGYGVTLFLLASFWVAFSTPISLPIYLLLSLFEVQHSWVVLLTTLVLPYVIPICLTLLQVSRRHDALTRFVALRDGLKGLFQFALSLFVLGGPAFLLSLLVLGASLNPDSGLTFKHFLAAIIFPTSGTLIIIAIAIVVWRRFINDRKRLHSKDETRLGFLKWYKMRFLKSYHLSSSLLHPYGLEKFLSDLFDPKFYAETDWGKAWEDSLNDPPVEEAKPDKPCISKHSKKAKKIGDYYSGKRNPRIAVGLAVADVGRREINVMDEDAPVVCGLRAATAWTPLFPPVRDNKGRLFVDSMNVSPAPLPALIQLLNRHGVNKDSTVIQIYRVAPVPFSRPHLPRPPQSKPMLDLLDIALRAVKLRQLRDADLERRLTERYTRFIPAGKVSMSLPNKSGERFRMWVAPIEHELPVGLNARIMFASRDERREEILTTIAQGCRAALEVMIADAIREARGDVQVDRTVPCAAAVHHHLTQGIDESVAKIFGSRPLPGSRAATECNTGDNLCMPPGLWEICQHCRLGKESTEVPGRVREQAVVWREWKDTASSWPHEFDSDKDKEGDTSDRHFVTRTDSPPSPETMQALGRYWPRERPASHANRGPVNRPLVSLLFSGGVFRGVFQVGVVNALDILGVKPDIVAGASIGSITAGMAAQLLCVTSDEQKRKEQLARLAATYLAVDRVILTDRFSDFVREFTIRSSGTRFSLRQADRLFRKYDQPWLVNFDKGARQVTGGIERLFYVSPYQLNQLVKSVRHRHSGRAGRMARNLAQQWLNRMNIGEEVLGAEALSELIRYFIPTEDDTKYFTGAAEDACALSGTFAPFLSKGVMLLATATDLTEGQLLTLGNPFNGGKKSCRVDLANALLASSAFPGVFRPRWAPEVFPDTHESHQLIDGGVMDNLPIDAVLNVLWKTSRIEKRASGIAPLIARRPTDNSDQKEKEVPHLFFAASLEPEIDPLSENDDALSELETYWPALRKRTGQLGYNFKLKHFRLAAEEISSLYKMHPSACKRMPLNLEIAALKPRWLCDTFAFHPMLGYRRAKQAESIAHGCAMTLLKFKEYKECKDRDIWLDAWGIKKAELPVENTLADAHKLWAARKLCASAGECWLRVGKLCPFSKEALKGLDLQKKTKEELSYIHTCCEMQSTHEAH